MNLGVAAIGPAGTGKSESIKDIAKGLGKYCIIYNCSSQSSVKMMEKFFIGICYTGA